MERIANLAHPLGASLLSNGACHFHVWAPRAERVEVHLRGADERLAPMQPVDKGYFQADVEAVRRGRKEEFAAFLKEGEPPDPAAAETFERSKLNWGLRGEGWHGELLDFYRTLIRLRRQEPALRYLSKDHLEVTPFEGERVLALRRWDGIEQALALFNLGEQPADLTVRVPGGPWRKALDSGGPAAGQAPDLLEPAADGSGDVAVTLPAESVALYLWKGR